MEKTISIIMKQPFPQIEELETIEALLQEKKKEPTPIPYGVMYYMYGVIQGKRQCQVRRGERV